MSYAAVAPAKTTSAMPPAVTHTTGVHMPRGALGLAIFGSDRAVVDVVREANENNSTAGRQIMVLAVDYQTSSALFRCASAPKLLDVLEGIFASPNVELFGNGQVVYKVPHGGHTVNCHQDAAFFEFGGSGLSPVGTLNYQIDTNMELGNGAIHVWPGSHLGGYIEHTDTTSHLGLPASTWPLSSGVAIEGKAGDSILFHQHLVHASPPNLSDKPRPTFINRYTRPEDPVIVELVSARRYTHTRPNVVLGGRTTRSQVTLATRAVLYPLQWQMASVGWGQRTLKLHTAQPLAGPAPKVAFQTPHLLLAPTACPHTLHPFGCPRHSIQATTAEGRRKALEAAKSGNLPARKRGYMLRGDRVFSDDSWDLGDKAKGQFH